MCGSVGYSLVRPIVVLGWFVVRWLVGRVCSCVWLLCMLLLLSVGLLVVWWLVYCLCVSACFVCWSVGRLVFVVCSVVALLGCVACLWCVVRLLFG